MKGRVIIWSALAAIFAIGVFAIDVEAQQASYVRQDSPVLRQSVQMYKVSRLDAGATNPATFANLGNCAWDTTNNCFSCIHSTGWRCVSDHPDGGATPNDAGSNWCWSDNNLHPCADGGQVKVQVGATPLASAGAQFNVSRSAAGAATGFSQCENTSTSATAGKGCDYSFRMTDGSGNHVEQVRIASVLDLQAANPNTAGNTSSAIQFWTRSLGTIAERMHLTAPGWLGIGTTTPSDRLHVYVNHDGDFGPIAENVSTGVFAQSSWVAINDGGHFAQIAMLGSGFVSGATYQYPADSAYVNTDAPGGLQIATLANAPMTFYTNAPFGDLAAAPRVTINAAGTVDVALLLSAYSGVATLAQAGVVVKPYGVAAGNTGEARFLELAAGGTNYVALKAADALGGDTAYTLPTGYPASSGYALTSTTAGVLSWSALSGTIGGSITSGQVAYGDTAANTIKGVSTFTHDGTLLSLTAAGGGIILGSSATGKAPQIYGSDTVANQAISIYYPSSGTNVNSTLQVVPKGTGIASNLAQLLIYNTDFVADGTNYNMGGIRATGSSVYVATGKSGSGTSQPLILAARWLEDATTNANQLVLGTNGYVGVGVTPTVPFEINKTGAAFTGNAVLLANIRDTTPNKGFYLGYDTSKQAAVIVAATNSAASFLDFWTFSGAAWAQRVEIGLGMIIGAPTGGDKGIGTLNVSANIYLNNSAYGNPDYGLEFWATGKIERFIANPGAREYQRYSARDAESFARKKFHLPHIRRNDGGLVGRFDDLLITAEEQATWTWEHGHEIERLRARVEALEARAAECR